MNKRLYLVLSALLVFMLSLSSCGLTELQGNADTPLMVSVTSVTAENIVTEQITDSEAVTVPEITEDNSSEISLQEPFDGKFKPGTWFSYNIDECRYYFFNDDKSSGVRLSVKSGSAAAFMYEMAEGIDSTPKPAVFHIDTTDNVTKAEVTVLDSDHMTIVWDNKTEDKLTYLSDKGMNDFMFYIDKELCSMALKYYADISGKEDKRNGSDCITNEDGSVTIRVYKTENDNRQTVLAWYIVDRLSATGEQSDDGLTGNGTVIDLK